MEEIIIEKFLWELWKLRNQINDHKHFTPMTIIGQPIPFKSLLPIDELLKQLREKQLELTQFQQFKDQFFVSNISPIIKLQQELSNIQTAINEEMKKNPRLDNPNSNLRGEMIKELERLKKLKNERIHEIDQEHEVNSDVI